MTKRGASSAPLHLIRGIGFPIILVPLQNPFQFSPLNFTTGQILNSRLIAAGVVCLAVFRARAQGELQQPSSDRVAGGRLGRD